MEAGNNPEKMTPTPRKTSSGLEENVAGLLTYVLGFVTGIIFLLIEKENKFVRFHAMQSIVVFGAFFVISLVLNVVPVIGTIVSVVILPPLSLIVWIVLMVKAYQRKQYKLPIAGDFSENQLAKMK
ncbi:DUF4870 domain-containing protein [Bacillus sp. es.036]|uniref:DUF4870 domain-containing protein n=1 Tax=Bacillus sp. es.036 TaxID=1761764 RepID=UPI000C00B214|nr:DUF4870 domain-containing protein [Bacillus sp. es.036]PFG14913.1 putative membrane protein [Bacillus sp. es.036]